MVTIGNIGGFEKTIVNIEELTVYTYDSSNTVIDKIKGRPYCRTAIPSTRFVMSGTLYDCEINDTFTTIETQLNDIIEMSYRDPAYNYINTLDSFGNTVDGYLDILDIDCPLTAEVQMARTYTIHGLYFPSSEYSAKRTSRSKCLGDFGNITYTTGQIFTIVNDNMTWKIDQSKTWAEQSENLYLSATEGWETFIYKDFEDTTPTIRILDYIPSSDSSPGFYMVRFMVINKDDDGILQSTFYVTVTKTGIKIEYTRSEDVIGGFQLTATDGCYSYISTVNGIYIYDLTFEKTKPTDIIDMDARSMFVHTTKGIFGMFHDDAPIQYPATMDNLSSFCTLGSTFYGKDETFIYSVGVDDLYGTSADCFYITALDNDYSSNNCNNDELNPDYIRLDPIPRASVHYPNGGEHLAASHSYTYVVNINDSEGLDYIEFYFSTNSGSIGTMFASVDYVSGSQVSATYTSTANSADCRFSCIAYGTDFTTTDSCDYTFTIGSSYGSPNLLNIEVAFTEFKMTRDNFGDGIYKIYASLWSGGDQDIVMEIYADDNGVEQKIDMDGYGRSRTYTREQTSNMTYLDRTINLNNITGDVIVKIYNKGRSYLRLYSIMTVPFVGQNHKFINDMFVQGRGYVSGYELIIVN